MLEFDQTTIEALKYYVYRLEDPQRPTGSNTFYVGKGRGNRAFQHARDALENSTPSDKLERIREILRAGHEPRIVIHRHGLDDELTAFHIEGALIDAYGLDTLTNEVRGNNIAQGMLSAEAVIALYQAEPANIIEPAILIKIEREWTETLSPAQRYERTRRYWWARPHKKRKPPEIAFAVARGIIREVYRIESWETYPAPSYEPHDPTRVKVIGDADVEGCVGFHGVVAQEKAHYKNKSVRHLQSVGAQNPIKYLNCD